MSLYYINFEYVKKYIDYRLAPYLAFHDLIEKIPKIYRMTNKLIANYISETGFKTILKNKNIINFSSFANSKYE